MVEKAEFSSSLYHPKHWPMWFGVFMMRITQVLPLSWQMKLGKGMGRLVKALAASRTHTARCNLALCFPDMPETEREALLTRNFEETGKAIFDTINAWWWSDEKIQQHMQITGKEYVQDTLNAGHGVILFAVHCLPLEMGARIFGQFQPGVGVYRPHNNPVMEYLQVKGRLRSNKALVPKRDLRQMVRCLRNPDVIWYTADQDFGRSSAVFIPFYAVPDAATITGATTLAKLGKAKVLPFFVERTEGDTGYRIEIMPPLDNFPGEDEVADAIRGNKIIEEIINRNRAQYMWLHRRFKTRPDPTDKSLYK
ncbi:LpxL/LpxP family Kdo(2)-lipid IV(A) lauroyl/palmitoleoyl acyltransferase [Shewanella oneidensis MR-1]|uniref:Lipid A biosynthesis acyltransferase n=1 Tax=Shewanella oneidensis (strain ATCC 700550 / JCM 31522 / CIP 106686 / LMG 19005 / NCIMB 14063 / MR-1) TaxID=211586 RepID=Q8EAZ1_SHEON|nr:LpxL/LpxP family Kdo(2)-lipid IV(A) lauroyl/palmitoleoyl acyltransferase [Shewanella oneidensis]AAN56729.1 lipid A biosynthesis lauroyl acyltransferase LpxL [Shewanella oneidensis MR-1]MDX5998896.1 LpxL/LpxP family Kdo(2)-lipid IV(A) lauroyl/palmitoleoyl acyltransferase [Shewanella oneidensis]MEE2028547.1 Lipid A biosynthesis lauroyltransferase [Shewanella oneidensis]QKG98068.1 LpxL/LpxP family Kdo(2)-lipid IV(A) lauroyl/palmitoleoyl acyltransferase [Shewanella oneidensis MR-1]